MDRFTFIKSRKKLIGIVALGCIMVLGNANQLSAQPHKFDWATQIAGVGANTSAGDVYKHKTIVVDREGYIYNTGNMNGLVDFQNGLGVDTLSSLTNNLRRYIAKYTPDGALVWVKQFGNAASFTNVTGITLDHKGHIYLGGYFRGTFDLDPGTTNFEVTDVSTSGDIFISKLDTAGNFIWGKHIGGSGADALNAITTDTAGNVYAAGNFSGTVDFNPDNTAVEQLNGGGCFVLKLNSTGNFVWAKNWNGKGNAIELDLVGNVYTTGNFSGLNRDFNPAAGVADTFILSAVGNWDMFVSKLRNNGDFVWAKQMGGATQDESFSIAVDEEGSAYTTGIFSSTADFDPGSGVFEMTSAGPNTTTMEVFIAKLDSNGTFEWARQLNGNGSNWGYSIAQSSGKYAGIYATGVFRGMADFYAQNDTLSFTALGSSEGYLVKLNKLTGAFEWSKQIGANVSGSVAVDNAGHIVTAGWFNSMTVDVDPDPATIHTLNRVGVLDGFILKMNFCSLSDSIQNTSCGSYEFMGQVYNQSGVYSILNPEGCDSSSQIVLNLTIYNLDPVINVNGFTLGTTQPYTTYKWMKNGSLISGATASTYLVTENASYQVIVTNTNGCIDTSAAYVVNNVTSVGDVTSLATKVKIYPNPAQEMIYINSPFAVNITLITLEGKTISVHHDAKAINLSELSGGIYLLKITDKDNRVLKMEKLIKQNR